MACFMSLLGFSDMTFLKRVIISFFREWYKKTSMWFCRYYWYWQRGLIWEETGCVKTVFCCSFCYCSSTITALLTGLIFLADFSWLGFMETTDVLSPQAHCLTKCWKIGLNHSIKAIRFPYHWYLLPLSLKVTRLGKVWKNAWYCLFRCFFLCWKISFCASNSIWRVNWISLYHKK